MASSRHKALLLAAIAAEAGETAVDQVTGAALWVDESV